MSQQSSAPKLNNGNTAILLARVHSPHLEHPPPKSWLAPEGPPRGEVMSISSLLATEELGAHPDVRKETRDPTPSGNLIITSPSLGWGLCPQCPHASTPCGCQQPLPDPPTPHPAAPPGLLSTNRKG